jgi:hypothetical protein
MKMWIVRNGEWEHGFSFTDTSMGWLTGSCKTFRFNKGGKLLDQLLTRTLLYAVSS